MSDDDKSDTPDKAPDAEEPKKEGEKKPPGKPAKPLYKRPLLMGILMLLVITGVVVGMLAWRHSRDYATTDDAFIDIQSQFVSPQVAGRILNVLAHDYQDVKIDDVLVEIDPADYQTKLDQALAAQTQAEAQISQASAQVVSMEAQLAQTQANVVVAEVEATNAMNDLRRYVDLHKSIAGAVSQQQMDTSSTQAQRTSAQLAAAQKAVVAAQAQVGYANSEVEVARAGLKNSDAQVETARLNLSYTKVKARVNGRIANKSVAPGNYVEAGTDMMAVVPAEVYVTANFKETQLAHMRQGQAVEVHVDAYPDLKLRGHVDSVQPGSGAVFSVLPAQNATGNWVKIVQRVPVKVIFDQIPDDPQKRLSPGLSVEVKVSLR
jgi:membrane fusion protein (multidrug efflux system)